jgi:hypothetical protein
MAKRKKRNPEIDFIKKKILIERFFLKNPGISREIDESLVNTPFFKLTFNQFASVYARNLSFKATSARDLMNELKSIYHDEIMKALHANEPGIIDEALLAVKFRDSDRNIRLVDTYLKHWSTIASSDNS